MHVVLPSGAIARVSANVSAETLEALNAMTEAVIKANQSVIELSPTKHPSSHVYGIAFEGETRGKLYVQFLDKNGTPAGAGAGPRHRSQRLA